MEFFIALAVLIAVVELKEYRQARRAEKMARQMRAFARELKKMRADQGVFKAQLDAAAHFMEQANEFAGKAQTDLATIVNEYKLNGIPLGYKRKNTEETDGDYYVDAG